MTPLKQDYRQPAQTKEKWWLDNGQPARSALKPPQQGVIPNPNRPSDPYTLTDEPDWVTISRIIASRQLSIKSIAPPPPSPRNPNSNSANGTRSIPPPLNPTSLVKAHDVL
ncbi:hypothetical protein NA56DRAFT_661621 [Hyaloscypha hepaticicola]|uniref:Uncharacterized protein n=1 Tax=Hyaloscypha hepaticicola TaxID=2082293 RepID=A0A2J6PWG4_9HELO|nr:hypothetical protein NA56DRAFT_661621 [Hyaloscypha hepaticicola]